MGLSEQKKLFYQTIAPSHPNEWEVDEIFEKLEGLQSELRETLLAQVAAIWPVSHSLCFSYLEYGGQSAHKIPLGMFPEWVRQILDTYERKGLVGAREFILNIEKHFLQPMQGQAGVELAGISTKLIHLLRGISGGSLNIKAAALPGTDTSTIYLPENLQLFTDNNKNFLLYKLIAVLQYKNIESGLFRDLLEFGDIETVLSNYSNKILARDLFGIIQFGRVYLALQRDLPGLYRKTKSICLQLVDTIAAGDQATEQADYIRVLFHDILYGAQSGCNLDQAGKLFDQLTQLYERCPQKSGEVQLGKSRLLIGAFDFKKSFQTILSRRKEVENRFVALLHHSLDSKPDSLKDIDKQGEGGIDAIVDDLVVILNNQQKVGSDTQQKSVKIENDGFDLPPELLSLAQEISVDLGVVPKAYVQAAAGMAGQGVNRENAGKLTVRPDDTINKNDQTAVYDEWDFRRAGYRKNWCLLYEKTLQQVRSNFVESTVAKYRSQHDMLRRQFEMLRTQENYCRRRRHGDDIDFDALVEALGDHRAGLSPSDRLFVRLMRDTRDISTLFLVDMSNSTEGWVGLAMKEALVLMAEVMKILGDPYGIYGFSGMRRSKNELYHIKHVEESYNETVQQRIAAITPKEYTRMGPPIRHLSKRLLSLDSKVRLLVMISDGKPEDYDGYVGEYAIEDTRKALLEARGSGIHAFCITIDRANHDYLPYMFGRGNYLFVNNIKSLPVKMAEMYRHITS